MSDPLVAGLVGSLRDASHTRTALRTALDAADGAGAETRLVDLREYDLPPFDPDHEDAGDADRLRTALSRADTVLIGTPMYHGSYSGVVKNAIDYCGFDEFEGTTVGLLGVAGGAFPITALEHLRSICRALDAWVIPYQAAVPRSHGAFEDGEFRDDDLRERVETLGVRAVEYADITPDPATFESGQNRGA
ncbi:FMN reductase [Halorubrum sp. JWXQ-INN 858]|uniref:NADPH-dependent FMN reductase n=1 Tax=Halorubrum sp. JWXQ-INN 858 TaxID=2690782 RepID=UPI00135C1CCA|nr:NADPH-dependent FMN reductase [Halorubrum sp. JWXQ-INN 858]MWV64540.1 FMN reductase [Halorubrum sp. JWXQ-INN 858]